MSSLTCHPPRSCAKLDLKTYLLICLFYFLEKFPFIHNPLSLSLALSLTQELRKTGLENLFAEDHMKNTLGEEVIERELFVEERERERVCVCVR